MKSTKPSKRPKSPCSLLLPGSANLHEALEQYRKQRDNEVAVLQALRFAQQQADKPEPVAEVLKPEG
jgi:hypothetical protein